MARVVMPSWRSGLERFFRGLYDHFLPHERNGHVPHVLHHRVLFGYATLLVLLKVLVVVSAVALPASSLYSSAITPENVVALTNQARRDAGVPELVVNVQLAKAAQAKARDMLNKQYFAHVSPEGVTPWVWIKGAGYTYSHAGENLAIDFVEAEGVQAGWMASPTHRANVIDPRYHDLGVAVAQGQFEGHETFIVVQMFGTPQTETVGAGVVATKPVVATEKVAVPVSEPVTAVKPIATTQVVAAAVVTAPAVPINSPQDKTALTPTVQAAVSPELSIDESSVRIVPATDGYAVEAKARGVTAMTVHLGDRWADLTADPLEANHWVGVVPAPAGGEEAYLLAVAADGRKVATPVAWVAPQATLADTLVPPVAGRSFRLFGVIPVTGLDDRVRQIYVISMALLGGALLVSLMAKFHIQRHAMTVHCLLVIFLAGMLVIM